MEVFCDRRLGWATMHRAKYVRINIPVYWRHLTNNQAVVEVHGDTVGQCLDDLVRQFPKIRQGLFDKNGKLLNYVYIYVNLESSYPQELTKLVKHGDEISIIPMISGG